jgi:phospholipase/lecithinase/hemolysin
MSRERSLRVLAAAAALGFAEAAPAGPFSGIVVFGDSLSDVGNLCPTPCPGYPVPPYASGRFSNGPLWIEGLAAGLGLVVSSSESGGNDYAVAGAQSEELASQVAAFSADRAGAADAGALHVVWAGGNDGFQRLDPLVAAANVVQAVDDLAALGARAFLVPNLPDLSLTPWESGNAAAAQFTLDFNAALAAGLAGMQGVTVFSLDAFALTNEVVASPAAFGLGNVTQRCWNGSTACSEPDEYLFWDAVHPTAAAHAILAGRALAVSTPCANGLDDDGDGLADPADPGCFGPSSLTESPQCQDGVSNDGDGLVDFDGGQSVHGACGDGVCPPGVSDPDDDGVADPDPQCTRPYKNREAAGCGLGFELALLLPALRGLRRLRCPLRCASQSTESS